MTLPIVPAILIIKIGFLKGSLLKNQFWVLQRRRRCNTQNWFQNENYWRDEHENKVPTICDMASTPLSHRWLSGVEAISLGTLIYCCSQKAQKGYSLFGLLSDFDESGAHD